MNNNNKIDHILNVEGILKHFDVAQKVTNTELDKIKRKVENNCPNGSQKFNEMMSNAINEYTKKYIKNHKIPGIIIPGENNVDVNEIDDKYRKLISNNSKFHKIHEEALNAADFLKNGKHLTKSQMIFFIISLVAILKLTQDDFNKFNEKLQNESPFDKNDDEDIDDDED